MKVLLSNAMVAFFYGFVGMLVIVLPGVWASPNLNGAVGVGVAALAACIGGGLRAVKELVPQFTWASIIKRQPFAAWADAFTQGFLGAFLTSLIGISAMPDLSAWHSLIVGALVGALAAGMRAVTGIATPGEWPRLGKGLIVPPPVVVPTVGPPA